MDDRTPYARSAPAYAAAGWSPVPMTGPVPGTPKGVPYEGLTGKAGITMTARHVELFLASDHVAHYPNVSLRMEGTVGLDVDHYQGRLGAQTLADLETKLGPLPPTWISTARQLPSGIRIFTLPAGVELGKNAEAMVRTIGTGLDIVRRGHRYVKCWPTPHPTGALYHWFLPDGTTADGLPRVADLPELPGNWVAFLTLTPPTKISKGSTKLGTNSDVERVFTEDEALAFVAPFLAAVRATPWGVGAGFNAVLNDAAYTLRGFLGLWSEEQILHMLSTAVEEGHGVGLDSADLATIRSGLGSPADWSARHPDERESSDPFAFGGKYAPMHPAAPLRKSSAPAEANETVQETIVCDAVGRVEGEPLDELFLARPELSHVRHFARSRRASPIACLATVLLRIATATPWQIVLPPMVGGVGSLNMFLALTGASSRGKSATEDAAIAAVRLTGGLSVEGGVPSGNLGSGQGLAAAYLRWVQEKGGAGYYVRGRDTTLFRCGEVGELAALKAQGATIGAVLREAWTGKALGNTNADPKLNRHVPQQQYRLCLLIGVQAALGGTLLNQDEIAAGTPQRFIWVDVRDRFCPTVRPAEPAPLDWEMPHHGGESAFGTVQYVLSVCPAAAAAIDAEIVRSHHGQDEDPLDGHMLFCRLKLAAAFGLFNGHAEVDCEDWRLAGLLIEHSNAARSMVLGAVAVQEEKAADARAKSRGREEIIKSGMVMDATEQAITKAVIWALEKLTEAGETGMTGGELTRGIARSLRQHLSEALDRLQYTGQIYSEEVGGNRKGLRWFLT